MLGVEVVDSFLHLPCFIRCRRRLEEEISLVGIVENDEPVSSVAAAQSFLNQQKKVSFLSAALLFAADVELVGDVA
jgi:hypothetical protein